MVRFLHTADVQLGMRSREGAGIGAQLREARFRTLEAIVTLAREEQVDFVLIAGDLFEDNQVNATTVARTVQILQKVAPIPVFILPGNHDPLDGGSIYHRPEFRAEAAGNVRVFRKSEPVPIDDRCILYPCPLTSRLSMNHPTSWIPPREEAGGIRIGVAHGGVMTLRHDVEHPIPVNAPRVKGLDYLALGDWHGRTIYDGNAMAYPGTPEQTSFGEERTGEVLLVAIPEAGAMPEIDSRPVHTLHWLNWTREIVDPVEDGLRQIQEEITALENGADILLRLTLTGTMRGDDLPLLDQFFLWLEARRANGDLLLVECRNQLRTSELLAGALRGLCDCDPVVAGVLADLQALAQEIEAAPTGEAARPQEELLSTWLQTEPPPHLSSAVIAQEAVALLSHLSLEVRAQ